MAEMFRFRDSRDIQIRRNGATAVKRIVLWYIFLAFFFFWKVFKKKTTVKFCMFYKNISRGYVTFFFLIQSVKIKHDSILQYEHI